MHSLIFRVITDHWNNLYSKRSSVVFTLHAYIGHRIKVTMFELKERIAYVSGITMHLEEELCT